MSRSRKKHPFQGITCCVSEKDDKRIWHRRFRRNNRQLLHASRAEERLRSLREVSDPWDMGKDGKWRFDPHQFPRLMRK